MPGGATDPRAAAASSFTISFAGFNRAWAAWIGDRLEQRGHRVSYQRWDLAPDELIEDRLQDLALAPGLVLIVFSEWYFHLGPRTQEEWNAALRAVVVPNLSRFAAVSLTTASVPSAAAVLEPVSLINMGASDAERRILERLDLPYEQPPDGFRGRSGPRFPGALPEVWGGVPRRNIRFTGRESRLNDVYHLLQDSEPGTGVLTLHGMSGAGKTQLASEYVYRFGSEYDMVWWVNAEKRVTYRRELAELAPRLGLHTGAEYGERLRAVRDALRRGEPFSRWLLILDGADEPDQIWDLVPTGPGHVLITSRNPEWMDHNSKLLEVPVYTRGESVAFIRRRAPRLTEAEADRLAEALEDLPLLLSQTAGWLNDSDLSVENYIALLEDGLDQDVVKVSADFPLAFQTAWSILLNKLRETVPESVDLLRLCTFFMPGSIPVRLLREMPHDNLPEQLTGLLEDPLLWHKALNQLRQYSVIRMEPDEVGDATLYMHRMVHQIVNYDMPDDDRLEFMEVAHRALVAADPRRPEDTRLWHGYAEIVPHLEPSNVLKSVDPAARLLVLNCLQYMYLSGEYHAGIKLGERALQVWRAQLGEDHPRVWELTRHYANLLRAVGDYQRTEAIEREAVERLRQQRGEQDRDYLSAATGLASDLWGLARYAEALELTERTFTTYHDLLGANDPNTLNARNNVALSLRLLGRFEESVQIDRETMNARRLLQKGHDALFSEVSYAIGQRLLGHYRDAESVQAKNVREYRIVMGPDNPQTLRAEHNLALCLYNTGDPERAGKLLEHALERGERVMGETHPWTLLFATGQSCFARAQGNIDQAQEIDQFVVARYEAMLPAGHPFIAGVRANHALTLQSTGETDRAHAAIEQSLIHMTAAVGENHPWTLGCAINASALRNAAGDREAAAALSADTVSRSTEALGPTHPLTLSARVAHAADLRGLKDRHQAEKIEQETVTALVSTAGKQHPQTISAHARKRPYWDFEPQAT
ncbi:TIR domain-containing protein [Streptomyces sp. uw30]|nr:FxSxx-COOH system tetratricopeptide repeat protein [Streptomyces sp. uw30]TXS35340.1 TIR domain-containing protein [Streptomyces sp. uw30]